ncbi:MAG: B12-binding domain-containing radical SAM protein, partial [Candidatus Omnitrophica bacterium]|nr:B12-binding domain-containing radical SAM protein [Candidatus Omnitrophota bacterium]
MKVLFVTPPMGSWATHGDHKAPNQYYAQIAAYLREKEVADVQVIDAKALGMSQEKMLEEIKKADPDICIFGDLLHSTGGLSVIWHFNETAKKIKAILPDTKILMGGLWYSAYCKETLVQNPDIDFIAMGEGELTITDLINSLSEKDPDFTKIPGLVSRANDGSVQRGPHRDLILDLNTLPMPAYDLFPMEKYVGHTYWKPFAELLTSRGCPGACTFCYQWSLYDERNAKQDYISWRGKSHEKILDEMDLLEKRYGVKVVVIQDDAFNVDKENVRRFCEMKIARGNKIKWVCLGRADDWLEHREIMPLMYKAGLFMGLVGIEVESDEQLAKQGKGVTLAQIKETVKALREANISSVGTVLIGLEDDDEATIKKRFEVANDVDPDIMALDYVTPVPGSPLWREALEKNWFDPNNIDLKQWDFHHPVIPTKHLTIEQVGRLGSWCMREFYSRPER